MTPGDPVHVQDNTAVDLQGAYSASVVADGKIIAG
jgi:hypothetical protein